MQARSRPPGRRRPAARTKQTRLYNNAGTPVAGTRGIAMIATGLRLLPACRLDTPTPRSIDSAAGCRPGACNRLWRSTGHRSKIRKAGKGARSSAGEHCLHTAGVAGSNPAAPTNVFKGLAKIRRLEIPAVAVACRKSRPKRTGPARAGLRTKIGLRLLQAFNRPSVQPACASRVGIPETSTARSATARS